MFTSRHLVEWLEGHCSSGAKVYNDQIPPTGRIIYVRLSSGPGLEMEGAQDNLTFSLEIRGADRNYDDAEFIAFDIDRAILQDGGMPVLFPDGTYMHFMDRTGGPPTQLTVADTAGRYAFTCNYFVCVATDL